MAIFHSTTRIRFALYILCGITCSAHAAYAATLSISPANSSAALHGLMTERVVVSSTDQAMNAAAGTVTFPTDLLQVVSVSKGSTIPLWVQDPTYSNSEGTISFSGVVPNPGYQGSGGTVLTIVFRAVGAGTAGLHFASASVLANDGQGTEIITSAPGANVTITSAATGPSPEPTPVTPPTSGDTTPAKPKTSSVGPMALTSPTHPDQSAWYNRTSIVVSWKNPSSATQVRTSYDTDPSGKPAIVYSSSVNERTFAGDDGVTYFHLQVRDSNGWGPVSSYRFNIDTKAPQPPALSFIREGTPHMLLNSNDTLSGMRGYEIQVNDGTTTVQSASSTSYNLTPFPKGLSTVQVIAVDNAGNRATSSAAVIVLGATTPGWTSSLWNILMYSSPLILLLLVLALLAYVAWFLWNRFMSMRARTAFRAQSTSRALSEQFAELREALTEEDGALGQLASQRELTLEERRFFKRFTTQLDKAEEFLERRITHIPD